MYHELNGQTYILFIYGDDRKEERRSFAYRDEAYKALREAQASEPNAKYKLVWRKMFYSDWELDTK